MADIQTIYKKMIMKKNPYMDAKTAGELEKLIIWLLDADAALKVAESEAGKVELPCPNCDGMSFFSREYIADDRVTVRAGCNKCDFRLMG